MYEIKVLKKFNISEKIEAKKIEQAVAKCKETAVKSGQTENEKLEAAKEAIENYMIARLFRVRIREKRIVLRSKKRNFWINTTHEFKQLIINHYCDYIIQVLGELQMLLVLEEKKASTKNQQEKDKRLSYLAEIASIMVKLISIRDNQQRVSQQSSEKVLYPKLQRPLEFKRVYAGAI